MLYPNENQARSVISEELEKKYPYLKNLKYNKGIVLINGVNSFMSIV